MTETLKEFTEENNVVSVVRCKDCKYWRTGISYVAVGKCWHHDIITNKNYYCADGVKRG